MTTIAAEVLDPEYLVQEALALTQGGLPPAPEPPVEAAIRQAARAVLPDLFTIERLRAESQPVVYAEIFGGHVPEKLAALTYLARHLLYFAARTSGEARDMVELRRLLTDSMQALFGLQAAEGLGILYDYASTQLDGINPPFWEGVCTHLLYMLALLPEARPYLLAFLQDHATARRHIERMMTLPDAERAAVARALGEEYVAARKAGAIQAPPPAAFRYQFEDFETSLPGDLSASLLAVLVVQSRVRRAIDAGDFADLGHWLGDGSPLAARAAWARMQGALAPHQVVEVMTALLRHDASLPVRAALAVLEIGRINRAAGDRGDPNLIPLLLEAAMTDIPARAGSARLAARELAAVDAFNESLYLMEYAPIIAVGEEALLHLRNSRRLTLAEPVVEARPYLQDAYAAAFTHVQRAKSLMEAVWSAQADDLALMYLQQLKDMQAIPELQQLIQKRTRISDMANKTLAELKLSLSAYTREDDIF